MPDSNASSQKQAQGSEAYDHAMELLHSCCTEYGFLATPNENVNYRRIWSRDGVIVGLAALLTEDHSLINSFHATLKTLAQYQGPHGEIPSNVDPLTNRVSYGGTTGRVDASLWFVIGCGEYWSATGDDTFINEILPTLEKVHNLLGAWEYNNRGLLYVPQTGDWADEYIHSGYVLYDQLLYLQALRSLRTIHAYLHGTEDHIIIERIAHLKHLINANYWFNSNGEQPDDVYHEVLYQKGYEAAPHCHDAYWMPFFSPTGYGYRFDAFANVLVSLLHVAEEYRITAVDKYIDSIVDSNFPLLPAFHPVIDPVDKDWEELQITFSYTFKNRPYEYHNGGLWSMITGLYVADLARRQQLQRAEKFLQAINTANAMSMNDVPWSFAEYIHGKQHTPGGNQFQGWSAAATLIGTESINGKTLFRIDDA
jgi:hypothetical protein